MKACHQYFPESLVAEEARVGEEEGVRGGGGKGEEGAEAEQGGTNSVEKKNWLEILLEVLYKTPLVEE